MTIAKKIYLEGSETPKVGATAINGNSFNNVVPLPSAGERPVPVWLLINFDPAATRTLTINVADSTGGVYLLRSCVITTGGNPYFVNFGNVHYDTIAADVSIIAQVVSGAIAGDITYFQMGYYYISG
jgi:hypothetical protein